MTRCGAYRRRVVIQVQDRRVDAGIEDDFHHFRVAIEHDRKRVTSIKGDAIRFPWVTCPGASTMLDRLLDTPLRRDAARRSDMFDRFHQCTHQLELALLAVAAAARGESRSYNVTVADPDESGLQRAVARQDGAVVEEWELRAGILTSPAELAGHQVRSLRPWVGMLDDERYERVSILRRCLQGSSGRLKPIMPEVALDVPSARNACYAFQEERAALGYYIRDSRIDNSDGSRQLLDEFR